MWQDVINTGAKDEEQSEVEGEEGEVGWAGQLRNYLTEFDPDLLSTFVDKLVRSYTAI